MMHNVYRNIMAAYYISRYAVVSTGGTASFLENAGVSVTKVEGVTKFPEMVRLLPLYHESGCFLVIHL